MFDFRHLNHLVHVADEGSLASAARKLNITQPAVTKSLQKLEDQLQVRLFEKEGRRLVLTAIGRQIVEHGRSVLRSMNDTRELAERWREGRSGELRIGLGPAFTTILTEPLVKYALEYGEDLTLQIETGHSETLTSRLMEGEVDVIIHDKSPDPLETDLTVVPLRRSTVMGLLRADHPIANKTAITLDDLARWPIGHSPPPPRFDYILANLLKVLGANRKCMIRTENYDALAANCPDSDLIALLPENLGRYYTERIDNLTLVPLEAIPQPSEPHVFYRASGRLLPPAGHNLVAWIVEQYGNG